MFMFPFWSETGKPFTKFTSKTGLPVFFSIGKSKKTTPFGDKLKII